MAMTVFPSFFVMVSPSGTQRYLHLYPVNVDIPVLNRPSVGDVTFSEPQIWSPRTKFAAEISATGDRTLIHIRCCYNNKYLVVHDRLNFLVVTADKPEEDQTNPACTLFRVSSSSSSSGFQLYCISRSQYVSGIGAGLSLAVSGPNFVITDWETLVILPSKVSFRSEDLDGNYLCSRVIDRWYNYHRFESGLDVADPLVAHELFPTANGNYRIKNLHFGKFLRRSPDWIWADADEDNNSNDTLFSFVKTGENNVFGLRNLGNNNFCGGITMERKTDCLNAQYPNITKPARLIVEERVLRREISEIVYRLSDSRIYQEEIQEVSQAVATNDNVDNEHTITLSYSTSDSMTTYWGHSVSVTFGGSLEFKTSVIPFISQGTVTFSTEVGYTHEWGEQKTTERTREATYTAVVPPSTKIKVTLLCTKGACDVPFSYRQRDILTNGQTVTTIKDDGIYTGINSYNFYFQSTELVEDAQGRMYLGS